MVSFELFATTIFISLIGLGGMGLRIWYLLDQFKNHKKNYHCLISENKP